MKKMLIMLAVGMMAGVSAAFGADYTTSRVISVNVRGDSAEDLAGDAAGIVAVPSSAWNNYKSLNQKYMNGVTWDGEKAVELSNNWTALLSGNGLYWWAVSGVESILRVYIDDNADNHAKISFSDIPFNHYDVYVYKAADGASKYSPVSLILGDVATTYTCGRSGIAVKGDSAWGQSHLVKSDLGINVICIRGQTARAITIDGGARGVTRGGIAAVQLVEVETMPVYRATMTEDTEWGALKWDPRMPEEGFENGAKLEITVTGSPTLTFGHPVSLNCELTIHGTPQISLADSLYEDGCWQHEFASFDTLATKDLVTFAPVKTGFAGAYSQSLCGFTLRAQNKEVISINFANGQSVSGEAYTGLAPVQGNTWMNVTNVWISPGKTVDLGALMSTISGTTATQIDAAGGACSAKNTYGWNSATDVFLRGYLDDGNRAQVTITNIPYSSYDVIVYCATDIAAGRFGAISLNGTSYTYDCNNPDRAKVGDDNWGFSHGLVAAYGVNALRIRDVRSPALTILGGKSASPLRGCIAAVQIICTGDIISERPQHWYRFDTGISASSGTSSLSFSSYGDSASIEPSPWGMALGTKVNGPWGRSLDLPKGDWTYHIRAKMPPSATNAVVWCIGNTRYSPPSLMLLSRGKDGLSLATVKSRIVNTQTDFDVSGLTSDYHNISVVYKSENEVLWLFVDGVKIGEHPYVSQTGRQGWQWFSPYGGWQETPLEYLQTGAGVLVEEMRFYGKALSDADLIALCEHASALLTEDEDWSIQTPSEYSGKMVILNGHTITVTDPGSSLWSIGAVTDVDPQNFGRVVIDTSNAVSLAGNKIVGRAHYVKRGPGILELTGNTSASCDIEEGTVKIMGCSGFVQGATVTVFRAGCIDVNGCHDTVARLVLRDGGTLTNTGKALSAGTIQFGCGCELQSCATGYVMPLNAMMFVAPGHGEYPINLNGGTLIKDNGGKVLVANGVITGGGTIQIKGGEFNIGFKGLSVADDVAFETINDPSSFLWIGSSCSVPTIVGNGYVASDFSALTVTKRFSGLVSLGKSDGSCAFSGSGKLTLADGVTLDLASNVGTYAAPKNLVFGPGTIAVNLSGRSIKKGDKIIAWETIPVGTMFVWDEETAKSGIGPSIEADGLYYGTERLLAPVFCPDGALYSAASQNISISCNVADARIYYTTDGTQPSATNGRLYKEPFDIYLTTTMKAIAIKDGWRDSDISSATFTKANAIGPAINLLEVLPDNDKDSPWTVVTDVTHDGVSAVKSGAIEDDESTTLKAVIYGAGELSFWWKASCEPSIEGEYYDYGTFYNGSTIVTNIAGVTEWQHVALKVPGTAKHTFKWTYQKDGSGSTVPDCIWLDQVQWLPETTDYYADHTLTTETPVKYKWLRSYGLAVEDDFEAAAKAKTGKIDGAGRVLTVEDDFVAGTDPTNLTSRFASAITMEGGVPKVIWEPDLGEEREYKVWGRESLVGGDWVCPANPAHRFFKVTVEMP